MGQIGMQNRKLLSSGWSWLSQGPQRNHIKEMQLLLVSSLRRSSSPAPCGTTDATLRWQLSNWLWNCQKCCGSNGAPPCQSSGDSQCLCKAVYGNPAVQNYSQILMPIWKSDMVHDFSDQCDDWMNNARLYHLQRLHNVSSAGTTHLRKCPHAPTRASAASLCNLLCIRLHPFALHSFASSFKYFRLIVSRVVGGTQVDAMRQSIAKRAADPLAAQEKWRYSRGIKITLRSSASRTLMKHR